MLLHNNCLFSFELKIVWGTSAISLDSNFLIMFIYCVQRITLRSPFFPHTMWVPGDQTQVVWLLPTEPPLRSLSWYLREKHMHARWVNNLSFFFSLLFQHSWSYVYFAAKDHILPYSSFSLLTRFIQFHMWANLPSPIFPRVSNLPSPILSFLLLLSAVIIGICQVWFLLSLSNSTWMLPVFSGNKRSRKQVFFLLIVTWSVNSPWTLALKSGLQTFEWQQHF